MTKRILNQDLLACRCILNNLAAILDRAFQLQDQMLL